LLIKRRYSNLKYTLSPSGERGLGKSRGREMDNFEILRRSGYTEKNVPVYPFAPWRVNRGARSFFENGAVEDADGKWLEDCVKNDVPDGECAIYIAVEAAWERMVALRFSQCSGCLTYNQKFASLSRSDRSSQEIGCVMKPEN
jgi:hypothetical protein